MTIIKRIGEIWQERSGALLPAFSTDAVAYDQSIGWLLFGEAAGLTGIVGSLTDNDSADLSVAVSVVTTPIPNPLVAAAAGTNETVAVAGTAANGLIYDGSTWALSNPGIATVAVASGLIGGSAGFTYISTGVGVVRLEGSGTYNSLPSLVPFGNFVSIAHGGGVWIVIDDAGIANRSTDGTNYALAGGYPGFTGGPATHNTVDGAFFVAENSGSLYRSTDGLSWSTLVAPYTHNPSAIHAQGQYVFISLVNGDLWRYDTVATTFLQVTSFWSGLDTFASGKIGGEDGVFALSGGATAIQTIEQRYVNAETGEDTPVVPPGVPDGEDHGDQAVSRLMQRLRDQTGEELEALTRAYTDQTQELEGAAIALIDAVSLEGAEGVQLDGLGDILGREREGATDDRYRNLLKAQIRINLSRGTIEDIISAVRLVIGIEKQIEIKEGTYADFDLTVDEQLDPDVGPDAADVVYAAKPAGVHGTFTYWETDPLFRFDTSGGGFDDGYFGTSLRNSGGRESEIL